MLPSDCRRGFFHRLSHEPSEYTVAIRLTHSQDGSLESGADITVTTFPWHSLLQVDGAGSP